MELFFYKWSGDELHKPQNSQNSLICLHGMGGNGKLWRPLAASLENTLTVYAPDQRGHGNSIIKSANHIEQGYTPLDYGNDLVETFSKVSQKPYILLGHSMGVRSACAFAYLAPNLISSLILIDLGFSGPAGGGMGASLAKFIKTLPQRFSSREEARTYLNENAPDPSMAQYLLAVSQSEGGSTTFPFDRRALIETIQAAGATSVRGWLESFAKSGKPVYCLRGANSTVWAKEDYLAEKAHFSAFQNVHFEEWAGTGHGLPFEKRKELASLILRLKETIS